MANCAGAGGRTQSRPLRAGGAQRARGKLDVGTRSAWRWPRYTVHLQASRRRDGQCVLTS